MKVLSALKAGDPVTAIANLLDTTGQIALKAIRDPEERKLRLKLNEAFIIARSLKKATKEQKRALKIRLQAIKKGIRVAKAFNRPLDELNSDLDRVLALMGD